MPNFLRPGAVSAFFVLFLFSSVTMAAPVATLVQALADVQVNGERVKRGFELNEGDMVTTGDKGIAVIRFVDDQKVVLKANSQFKIDAFRYKAEDPANNKNQVALLKGGLRFVSGLLSKQQPEIFKLRTPTATAGIRGTEFVAVIGSLYIQVVTGQVTVTSGGVTLTVAAGQAVYVPVAGAAPVTGSQIPASVSQSVSQSVNSLQQVNLAPQPAGPSGPSGPSGGAGGGGAGGSGAGGAGGAGAGAGAGAGGAAAGGAAAAGAGAASGIAIGGVTIGVTGVAAAAVAVGAAVAAAAGGDDNSATATTGTTSTTSTSTATSTSQ